MMLETLPMLDAVARQVLQAPEAAAWVAGWLSAAVAMRLAGPAAPVPAAVEEALLAALAPV